MALNQLREAYDSYQNAVTGGHLYPTYWISIAILHYRVRQPRDCLDYLGRALRVYPFDQRTWMNLGILVCHCPPLTIEVYYKGGSTTSR